MNFCVIGNFEGIVAKDIYLFAQEDTNLFRWVMNCANLSEWCYNSPR